MLETRDAAAVERDLAAIFGTVERAVEANVAADDPAWCDKLVSVSWFECIEVRPFSGRSSRSASRGCRILQGARPTGR